MGNGRALLFLSMALMASAFSALCAHAQSEKSLITWLYIDWEPAWISEGRLEGTGYGQVPVQMLRARLTAYEHEDQRVNNVRTYAVLQNTNACFPISSYQGRDLRPGQADGLVFSAPTFLFFYHGVIAHREASERVRAYATEGYIDLERLIADRSLIGAYQPGRPYSGYLNQLFADNPDAPNLFRWAGRTRLTEGMFRMLDAKRFDYFIDYSLALKYHTELTGHRARHDYFPITGHRGLFGLGAIACHGSAFGRQVMADINRVLMELRKDPAYIAANARWLAEQGGDEEYERVWRQQLLPITE